MMRKCPKCNFTFSRAKVVNKIRHCPTCNTPLYYKGQETILLDDKLAVDEALQMVSTCIEKREGVKPFPDASDTARERKFAYDILERCKVFLQKNDAPIGVREFFIGLFKFILDNSWWYEHIKSILQLKNSISKLAMEYYSIIRSNLAITSSLTESHNALSGTVMVYAS